MDPQKKADYNRRAKNQKSSGKKTGTGESMNAVEREKKRQLEFQQNMNEEIQSMVALAMELGSKLNKARHLFIKCFTNSEN